MSNMPPYNARVRSDVASYKWLDTPDDLDQALVTGLIPLYKACFSVAPYNEFYTDQDVCDVFEKYKDKGGSILVARDKQKSVIGFSVKTPLVKWPSKDMPQDENETYCYGADLGIEQDYRRLGISTTLEYLQREKMADNYTVEITRTSSSSYDRIASNLKQGKRRLPFVEDVPMLRVDGTKGTDQRVYFQQSLRQARQTADQMLSRVVVTKKPDQDVAIIFDNIRKGKRDNIVGLVQENYPGITEVLFNDGRKKKEPPGNIIFSGAMPLNFSTNIQKAVL